MLSVPTAGANALPAPRAVTVRAALLALLTLLDEGVAGLDRLACFVSRQGRVDVQWLEAGRVFQVGPREWLGRGRQRVNCTAPAGQGRFYWYSHQWIVQ